MKTRSTMNGKPVFTVPSKTVINFKSHFKEKLLCDGLTFTAGTACPYSCSFCYVPDGMRKQMPWLQEHGVTGKHEDIVIRRDNAVETMRKQLKSKPWEGFRDQHKVIYASPLTDVAANMELVRETADLCKVILSSTNWDIRLLSKSNLLPKVAQELHTNHSDDGLYGSKKRIIYGVSTGTLDDNLAAAFEEGTPKVSKRIESLHWLQDNGYRTFGMICPSLPQLRFDDYYSFSRDMADAIRVSRCEHVWAEVINLRGESFTRTIEALKTVSPTTAEMLELVSKDKDLWESYSRDTFLEHIKFIPPEKLRFLQYVNNDNRDWWTAQKEKGAVLL